MSESVMEQVEQGMERYFFRVSASDFKKVPGSPIAYWISDVVRRAFADGQRFDEIGDPRVGMQTSNNNKYLRLWHEVSYKEFFNDEGDHKWIKYIKGGKFRRWYGNLEYLLHYNNDPNYVLQQKNATILSIKNLCLPKGTWTDLTSGKFNARMAPDDSFHDISGHCFYPQRADLLWLLGYANSKVFNKFIFIINSSFHFQVGDVAKIPILDFDRMNITSNSGQLVAAARMDWDAYETSWDFGRPALIPSSDAAAKIVMTYGDLRAEWVRMTAEMQRLEGENNRIFIEAYGLQDELTPDVPLEEITLTCNPHYRYGGNKTEEELEALLLQDTMAEFCSYAVGCMFGRYSLDKPGLVLANQGETLQDYLQQVPQPSFRPDEDNVIPLLDADWFADDVTGRFLEFLRVTFGTEHFAENLAFVERGLNIKNKRNYSIRDFFVKEFYDYHVKMYKKRPIYWLFASPRGTFQALVYLHRYRPDTVSVVLRYLREFRDKLAARRQLVEQRLTDASASQGEKTRLTKELEQLRKQILELDDYEHDVLFPLAGQRLEIDLDDGVKANYPRFGRALKKVAGLS